jgi:F-type H+-transporting ATPase subunit a
MQFSPDEWIIWGEGPFALNATIVFSWVVMAVLVFIARLATRRIEETLSPSRWQCLLETVVVSVRNQIAELSPDKPARGLPFIATLFLFIFVSNVMAVIPGFQPPTASLSTTAALAILVLIAVPVVGIMSEGPIAYLRHYIRPTIFMLPFNLIGEVTRTISLAVRLYGNVMSGTVLAAITLTIAPFFFPIAMQALSLLTGVIQAYIFAVLAAVYIASAGDPNPAAHPRSDKEFKHG